MVRWSEGNAFFFFFSLHWGSLNIFLKLLRLMRSEHSSQTILMCFVIFFYSSPCFAVVVFPSCSCSLMLIAQSQIWWVWWFKTVWRVFDLSKQMLLLVSPEYQYGKLTYLPVFSLVSFRKEVSKRVWILLVSLKWVRLMKSRRILLIISDWSVLEDFTLKNKVAGLSPE